MTLLKNKPAVVGLFAFANEQHGDKYLRNLPREYNQLQEYFDAQSEQGGKFEWTFRPNATYEVLLDLLQDQLYHNRIAFFHFGGHAGTNGIYVESDLGESATFSKKSLTTALSQHRHTLKFIFLNACHTEEIGQELVEMGFPLILGTREAVNDELAFSFASQFYNGLNQNLSVEQSWKQACHKVEDIQGKASAPEFRSLKAGGIESSDPWLLIKGKEAKAQESLDWSLSVAANDSSWGLPPLPPDIFLPDIPFSYFQSYERKDARIFWGRNHDIRDFFQTLNTAEGNPLILLNGLSGVGKSSFLNAGILPRLSEEQSIYLNLRSSTVGPWQAICQVLDLPPDAEPAQLNQSWLEWEKQKTLPLFIFFDQFEQLAYPESSIALNDFCKKMGAALEERIQGKLILAFRKEYLSEITFACRSAQVPSTTFTLGPLSKDGILEVVNGVNSSSVHTLQYQIGIETGLDEAVANLLLGNPEMPLTPVLQILMSKFYEALDGQTGADRIFSLELFQELTKKGFGLDHFLEDQLELVAARCPNEVESGLALDVLLFHTSNLGTCATHTLEEVQAHYGKDLKLLLETLSAAYLLVKINQVAGPKKNAPLNTYSLAHDTLGPVVQQHFKTTSSPGQEAHRLLESLNIDKKKEVFALSPEQFWLNEDQLKTLKLGKDATRMLSPLEEALMQQSEQAILQTQRKKRRNRLLINSLFGVLGMILSALLLVFYNSKQQYKANALMYEASALEEDDPTQAMALYKKSIQTYNTSQAWNKLYNLQRNAIFYTELKKPENAAIASVALTHTGDRIGFSLPFESTYQLKIFSYKNQNLKSWDPYPLRAKMPCLGFGSQSKDLIGAGHDHQLHRWHLPDGDMIIGAERRLNTVHALALSPNEEWAILAENNKVLVYSLAQKRVEDSIVSPLFSAQLIQALAIDNSGKKCLLALSDGTVHFYDRIKKELSDWQYFSAGVQRICFSASGRWLFLGGKAGQVWKSASLGQKDAQPYRSLALESAVKDATFDLAESRLVLCDSSGQAVVYDLATQSMVFRLRAKSVKIMAATFVEKGDAVISVTDQGAIWLWPIPQLKPATIGPDRSMGVFFPDSENLIWSYDNVLEYAAIPAFTKEDSLKVGNSQISALALSPDGQKVLIGSSDGSLGLLEKGQTELKMLAKIPGDRSVDFCFLTPQGNFMLANKDGDAIYWGKLNQGKTKALKIPFASGIADVAYDPEENQYYILSAAEGLWLLNAQDFAHSEIVKIRPKELNRVCPAPGKQNFFVGDLSGKIFEFKKGKCVDSLAQQGEVAGLVYDNKQHCLISASGDDGRINFWDTAQRQIFHQLNTGDYLYGLQISADNRWLLSYGDQGAGSAALVWRNDQVRQIWKK